MHVHFYICSVQEEILKQRFASCWLPCPKKHRLHIRGGGRRRKIQPRFFSPWKFSGEISQTSEINHLHTILFPRIFLSSYVGTPTRSFYIKTIAVALHRTGPLEKLLLLQFLSVNLLHFSQFFFNFWDNFGPFFTLEAVLYFGFFP